tara:strand:- start:1945 stop:3423 length:1479 start_codon:yes stop_codon:yes gene_type:complete
MAIVQGRTRAQLRQSVGYNLGAVYVSSASGTGLDTTIVDDTLTGGDDNYIGKWVVFNDVSASTVEVSRVSDYTASTTTLTVSPAFANASVANDTYELWDDIYQPARIEDLMNQSILDATGHAYDPVESLALHSDGKSQRFDIPSGLSMIQNIYYRTSVDYTRLLSCNTAMDEQSTLVATTLDGAITDATATSVTVASATPFKADQLIMVGSEKMTISSISSNTLTVSRGAGSTTAATHSDGASVLLFPITNTKIKKQGTASNQVTIPAGASAGQLITDSITSKDISEYDYLEGWIKITRSSEAATSAGNLKILLDDTANCASPLETLDVPALTDDTWTFFRVKLANPESDTAIISVGLEYDADLGACTVWLDDISVVKNDSAQWVKTSRNLWKIDKQEKDIIFDNYFHGTARYNLLKIVGGDKPTLLTADTDTSEIDEQYIIARATALAFASASGGPNTDPDNKNNMAGFWMGMSQQAKRQIPILTDVRLVE